MSERERERERESWSGGAGMRQDKARWGGGGVGSKNGAGIMKGGRHPGRWPPLQRGVLIGQLNYDVIRERN